MVSTQPLPPPKPPKKQENTQQSSRLLSVFCQGHKDLNRPDGLISLTIVKQAVSFPAVPETFSYHESTRLTTRHLPRKGKDKGKLWAA